MKKTEKIVYVLCDNIRSAHNVGSIFRTSDAMSVSKIILGGITPAPVDRFGRAQKEIAKTALGAERTVAWELVKNLSLKIKQLKKDGFNIVALEQAQGSINLKKYKAKYPMALILGEEVNGILKSILKLADEIIEIPMQGRMVRQAHHPKNDPMHSQGKESLNVSVACGIALYAILK